MAKQNPLPLLNTVTAHRAFPVLLVLFAAFLRFANMAFVSESPVFWYPTSDEGEHWTLAVKLAAGDWLGEGVGPYHRPQLFAYFLATLISLFGEKFFVAHIAIVLVDSLAVLAWYGLGRRAFPRPAAALGAIFICLYWAFIHFSGTGYMESFAMALMGIGLFFLSEHARRVVNGGTKPLLPLVGSAVFLGLSLLTRPQTLIVIPFLVILLIWLHWRESRRAGQLGYALLFPLLVFLTISPNAIRHLTMFKMWAPLGTGSELNFYMSNNNEGYGWLQNSPGIEYQAFILLPQVEAGVPLEHEANRVFWREKIENYLSEDPGHFLKTLAWKYLVILNAYEVHCTQNFQHMRSLSPFLRYLPGLGILGPFGILGLLFVLVGTIRSSGEDRSGNFAQTWTRVLLVTWLLIYLVGVGLFLAISRHRLPALPPLMLLGGWAAWLMIGLATRRRFRRLFAWIAAWLLAFALMHLPVIPANYPRHERWWTQVNLGVALWNLGSPEDLARAEVELQKANEILPEKPEGYRQLAVVRSMMGRHADAVEARRSTIRLLQQRYPRHTMLHAREMEAAIQDFIQAGILKEAEAEARRLVSLMPDFARSRLMLAEVLMLEEKYAEALEELSEALALDPGNPVGVQRLRELSKLQIAMPDWTTKYLEKP